MKNNLIIEQYIFVILFFFSLLLILASSLEDFLLIHFILQILWLVRFSHNFHKNPKKNFKRLPKFITGLIIFDFIILVLSISFGFRILFAYLYRPLMYFNLFIFTLSALYSYSLLYSFIKVKKNISLFVLLILTSTIAYPLSPYLAYEINKAS